VNNKDTTFGLQEQRQNEQWTMKNEKRQRQAVMSSEA
jgi:hypothetical protein